MEEGKNFINKENIGNNNLKIIKDIEQIILKYNNKVDNCINQFRYDEDEKEFNIKEELEEYFKANNIDYEIEITSAYSSCSYEVDILSVSYIDSKNKVHLYTKKLELY